MRHKLEYEQVQILFLYRVAVVVQEEHRTVVREVLADRERYVLILFNLRVKSMKVVK